VIRSDVRICWLGAFGQMEHGDPMPPCSGPLIRAHLIPKQTLKREHADPMDPRSWVWACGGIAGNGGHHGALDHSRSLRLPRGSLPPGVEELAAEIGLEWYLDKTFGERETMR